VLSVTATHLSILVLMATTKETVAFLLEQLAPLDVRARAMFGEYGLYCDEKVVGFICDDLLFIKPSAGDADFAPETIAAPCYPGSKDYWLLNGSQVDNTQWLQAFVQSTADALPAPKPKKPR
jgi:TfoX/Sxy family transcriptional regulator of competence genes